jgi:hypothetical protein
MADADSCLGKWVRLDVGNEVVQLAGFLAGGKLTVANHRDSS